MPMTSQEVNELLSFIKEQQLKIEASKGWRNFCITYERPSAIVLKVQDIPSLQALMKKINIINDSKEKNERILARPVAGGIKGETYSDSFSLSKCADADIFLQLVGDFHFLKLGEGENTVAFGPNVNIGEIDHFAFEELNLSLPTSSLIYAVTGIGLAANGGHGAGWKEPSFAGLQTRLKVMLQNGEIVTLDNKDPDFNAIVGAHLGAFGIVIEAEVQCRPAENLCMERTVMSFKDALAFVKNGGLYEKDYTTMAIVPKYRNNVFESDEPSVVMFQFYPVPLDTPYENYNPQTRHMKQNTQVRLSEFFNVNRAIKTYPHLVKYFTRVVIARAELSAQAENKMIGPWYATHNLTNFPSEIVNVDYQFPNDKDNSAQAVYALTNVMQMLLDFYQKGIYPVSHEIFLRNFGGTNGGLSPSCHAPHQTVCSLDVVSAKDTQGFDLFSKRMQKLFMGDTLKGKPHWGKHVPKDIDYEEVYGEGYRDFMDALENWYSFYGISLEKSPFLNTFLCEVLKKSECMPAYHAHVEAKPVESIKKMQDLRGELLKLAEQIETIDDESQKIKNEIMYLANHAVPTPSTPSSPGIKVFSRPRGNINSPGVDISDQRFAYPKIKTPVEHRNIIPTPLTINELPKTERKASLVRSLVAPLSPSHHRRLSGSVPGEKSPASPRGEKSSTPSYRPTSVVESVLQNLADKRKNSEATPQSPIKPLKYQTKSSSQVQLGEIEGYTPTLGKKFKSPFTPRQGANEKYGFSTPVPDEKSLNFAMQDEVQVKEGASKYTEVSLDAVSAVSTVSSNPSSTKTSKTSNASTNNSPVRGTNSPARAIGTFGIIAPPNGYDQPITPTQKKKTKKFARNRCKQM